jgi:hypothetical protein
MLPPFSGNNIGNVVLSYYSTALPEKSIVQLRSASIAIFFSNSSSDPEEEKCDTVL